MIAVIEGRVGRTSVRTLLAGRFFEIVDAALFLAKGSLKSGSTLFIDSGQFLLSQPRDVIFLAREKEGAT